MNLLLGDPHPSATGEVVHSLMAYERASEELCVEIPIPAFLDTLALKIAGVPRDDAYGALSYPLDAKAADTFRFLLGLEMDTASRDYFLESTVGSKCQVPGSQHQALGLLSEVSAGDPRPEVGPSRITEREMVYPTLRCLHERSGDWLPTSELVDRLTQLLSPSGRGGDERDGSPHTYFMQRVQDIIAHRRRPSSFVARGLADFWPHRGFRITEMGHDAVQALMDMRPGGESRGVVPLPA